jgi:tetratricopeptide (TPR) repeat protein
LTASRLPAGGRIGAETYKSKIARITKAKEAYMTHDKGRKALAEEDYHKALSLASDAIRLEPQEALFYGLKGDARIQQQLYQEALLDYTEAIKQNNEFFQFYLQRGLVREKLGDLHGAESDLQKSVSLFPTVHAHYSLGNIALTNRQENRAIEHFRIAASSSSDVGKKAWASLARLELPAKPEQYFAFRISRDKKGYVILTIINKSPLNTNNIEVAMALYDQKGRILQREIVRHHNTIKAGQQSALATHIGPLQDDEQLRSVQTKIMSAMVAQ